MFSGFNTDCGIGRRRFLLIYGIITYADEAIIGKTFWRKGNFVVIGQYALMIFLFYRIYGGFKVGYLRVFEVLIFPDPVSDLRQYDYVPAVEPDWTMEVFHTYSATGIYDWN